MVKTSSTSTSSSPCTGAGMKGPGDVGVPRLRGQRRLGSRLPHPLEQVIGATGTPNRAAQRGRDPLTLIVPPLPKPAPAQRDRYQGYLPRQWLQLPHGLGHRLGGPAPALVLELVHRVAGGALEPDRAARPGSPAGQSAQSRHSRSSEMRLAAAVADRMGDRAASGSGRGRRSARRLRDPGPARCRAGRRAAAASAPRPRAHAEQTGSAPGLAKRCIDRCPHHLDRRMLAGKPALERGGALRHQHGAPIGRAPDPGPHRPDPGGLAAARTPCRRRPRREANPSGLDRKRIVRLETERGRVDQDAAVGAATQASTPTGGDPALEAALPVRDRGSAAATAHAEFPRGDHCGPSAAAGAGDEPGRVARPRAGASASSRPCTSVLSPTVRPFSFQKVLQALDRLRQLAADVHRAGGELLVRHGHVAATAGAAEGPHQRRRDRRRSIAGGRRPRIVRGRGRRRSA